MQITKETTVAELENFVKENIGESDNLDVTTGLYGMMLFSKVLDLELGVVVRESTKLPEDIQRGEKNYTVFTFGKTSVTLIHDAEADKGLEINPMTGQRLSSTLLTVRK